jgi:hypothetical protein
MNRTCLSLALALLIGLGGAASAQAQTAGKRLIRIHTAGPNDLGVDNTFLAQEFADHVNANAPSLEVKVFANSQLGQSREVIEAMRLGSGAAGTSGGPAEYAAFVKRVGVLGLPFLWKSYDHASTVLSGEVGQELDKDMQKAGFKVLAWSVSWGYRNVVTAKKEVTKAADLKGPQDPHDPDQGVRRGGQRHGCQRHADELRRDLHVAAERRARRLRAHRRHHRLLQAQRSRVLHRLDTPPDGSDGPGLFHGRMEEAQ